MQVFGNNRVALLSLSLSRRLKLSKLAPLECAGGRSKVCSGGKKSALSGRRERRWSRRRHRDTIGFLLNKVEWPHGGERAGRKAGRKEGRKERRRVGWLKGRILSRLVSVEGHEKEEANRRRASLARTHALDLKLPPRKSRHKET